MFKTAIRKFFTAHKEIPELQAEITVLYGGKSGNSEFVARETGRHFLKHGLKASVRSLSRYRVAQLVQEKFVLIIVSTHGEGEPPPAAASFCRELQSSQLDLRGLEYAVCALGDSTYEHFCRTGKEVDRRLERMGARRFLKRTDCDACFEQAAGNWIRNILNKRIPGQKKDAESVPKVYYPTCEATLKERILLNPGSAHPVFHLSLTIEPGTIEYAPGDTIGIFPQNPPELVNAILKTAGFDGSRTVTFGNMEKNLGELLASSLEITTISRHVLRKYRELTSVEFSGYPDGGSVHAYCRERDFLDLMHDFPADLSAEQMISLLPALRPRYYSIASSRRVFPDELHLTVKDVSRECRQPIRYGACSGYLCYRLPVGGKLRFHLKSAGQFRLPENAALPLIFIATGAGIAPFRAFLQELTEKKHGPVWLIFGEKHAKYDFLYRKEIENWHAGEILSDLDPVFSRDQENKFYVQNLIREKEDQLSDWISSGAVIYVCGSLKMGRDLRETLISLFEKSLFTQTGKSFSFLSDMVATGRYIEDVY